MVRLLKCDHLKHACYVENRLSISQASNEATSVALADTAQAAAQTANRPIDTPPPTTTPDINAAATQMQALTETHEPLDTATQSVVLTQTKEAQLAQETAIAMTPFTPGKSAFCLDGTGDYAEVPFSDVLNLSKTLTIEAWVNVEFRSTQACQYCNRHPIISQPNGTSSIGNYLLAMDKDLPAFGFEPATGADIVLRSTTALDTGQWNHVAVTHEFGLGTQTTLYLDGEAVGSFWQTGNPNEDAYPNTRYPYTIGYLAERTFFKGMLDELRIWNVLRTPDEIRVKMKS